MNNEHICRNVSIELTTSVDDWYIIRECYVRSFHRYPLYKYMVPDDTKRDDFLRAYLDANYEVTVGSGHGILLAIKIAEEVGNNDNNNNHRKQTTTTCKKVIGGVVFLPPSSDGCGWAIGSDEPYWQAYEKYGLAKISKEGLERVKKYEAWENTHVAQSLSRTRIPLWNGLFCAISPDYSSKGVGSTVYKEAIRIMAKFWLRQQKAKIVNKKEGRTMKKSEEDQKETSWSKFLVKFLSSKSLHRYTLLNHRALPTGAMVQKLTEKQNETTVNSTAQESPIKRQTPSTPELARVPPAPLVVAVSHSDRSANFHELNGFHSVARIPFHDPANGIHQFYCHVLVLDPFKTGKTDQLNSALLMNKSKIADPPTATADMNKKHFNVVS
ncbi:uncharacterized protein LOC143461092 [Clavelina lepadiformis]|uniref:uncharacterized protein LOC143461092 n=1 Tax=Clavelina lepadiformis TaxID=159417 RepID=UPI0040430570